MLLSRFKSASICLSIWFILFWNQIVAKIDGAVGIRIVAVSTTLPMIQSVLFGIGFMGGFWLFYSVATTFLKKVLVFSAIHDKHCIKLFVIP